MKRKKTMLVLSITVVLVVCSALSLQVMPVSAATVDITHEQEQSLQYPPPPPPPFPPTPPLPPLPPPPIPPHPPFPPPPHPVPPTPPPSPGWHFPGYPGIPWNQTWRWPINMRPRIIITEPIQRLPIYAPVINSFTACPSSVQSGQEVLLSWAASNADTITISPGVGSVSNYGSYR